MLRRASTTRHSLKWLWRSSPWRIAHLGQAKKHQGSLTRPTLFHHIVTLHSSTPHPSTPSTPICPPRRRRRHRLPSASPQQLRLTHCTPRTSRRLSRQTASPTVAREHLETRADYLIAASATACIACTTHTHLLCHTTTDPLSSQSAAHISDLPPLHCHLHFSTPGSAYSGCVVPRVACTWIKSWELSSDLRGRLRKPLDPQSTLNPYTHFSAGLEAHRNGTRRPASDEEVRLGGGYIQLLHLF